jgi:hypothetical protein
VTAERGQYEQGPVAVDGAWFAVVDGRWRQVPNPNLPARKTAPSSPRANGAEQAPICVDGGWFAAVDGEWRRVPRPTSEARRGPTNLGGKFSVDGAHALVEHQPS